MNISSRSYHWDEKKIKAHEEYFIGLNNDDYLNCL